MELAVQITDAIAVERDGTRRVHVLIHHEGTSGPLPALAGMALQGEFLRQRVVALLLREREDIGRHKVLVHEEAVAQMLPGGNGREDEARGLPFTTQASTGQLEPIVALAVLRDEACLGGLRRLSVGLRQKIGAGVFVAIFIVGREVNAQNV